MKKRIIGVLLTLALILSVCSVAATGAGAAEDSAVIKAGDTTYTAKIGELVEYSIAFTYTGSNLATAQVELPVDFSALGGYTQSEINTHIDRITPATPGASVVQRFDGDGALKLNGYVMNFVSANGCSFNTQKAVMTLIFEVEKAGSYELAAKVRHVDDVNDHTVVDGNYQKTDSRFSFTETVGEAHLDTPKVSASTAAGGVKVSWAPVPGARLYRVYYKSGSSWKKLTDTTATSTLDTDVRHGSRYTYTVRCLSADGTHTISDYDRTGASAVYYLAPTLKLSNAEDGVSIKWDAVSGASKYRVYYKSKSGWKMLTETAGTSFIDTDVNSGKTYTYTIRTLDSNGNFQSHYNTDGFSITYITAPVFRLSNAPDGVQISWDASAGAENYRVFYKGASGWKKLADTTGTSFIDTVVSSGKSYTYTVRCLNANASAYTSDFRSGKSITYCAAPKLTLSNAEDGVSIKWNAVGGASQYRVYYKSSAGWKKLADTSGTSLVDEDVRSGSSYTYTIRAMDSSGRLISSYYPDGFRIQFIQAPVFSVSNAANGVKISWDKVNGAQKYRVFYKGASGWKRLTDTADTSFIDTVVNSGKTYTYTVRCINEDGSAYVSDFRSGKSVTFYAAPKLTLTSTSNGVSMKWDAITGAAKYRVFYKGSTGWKKLLDTTSASCVDTDVRDGKTYTYTIRAMDSSGSYLSSYYTDGFTITYQK